MLGTSLTYIGTVVIYFEYIVIQYTTYLSFNSDFFTIFDQNEKQAGDGYSAVIIGVYVAVAAILIVLVLVVLLIRIRSQKQINDESEGGSEQANEDSIGHVNSFSTGITMNVEEDPFAEDFNEEKYFGEI